VRVEKRARGETRVLALFGLNALNRIGDLPRLGFLDGLRLAEDACFRRAAVGTPGSALRSRDDGRDQ
jgi:hypothetical protein